MIKQAVFKYHDQSKIYNAVDGAYIEKNYIDNGERYTF